jgi:glycosyltransferase involved in cell wall biosynthesis
MIRYSVIIPQHNRADEVRRQLPSLAAALSQFNEPYEIIIVDDGSDQADLRLLEKLLSEVHSLRLLRLDHSGGVSVALSAGIRACRGEIIMAIEPGEAYPPQQIATLVEGLHRADFLAGRRRQTGAAKIMHRITRLPRWFLLGLDGHDPDCLFWAARREVFTDITLPVGSARYLPALIARRGFRACELFVEHHGDRRPLQDVRPNLGDLLAAWWQCRRWRSQTAYELTAGRAAQPQLRVVAQEAAAGISASTLRFHPAEQIAPIHYSPAIKHA